MHVGQRESGLLLSRLHAIVEILAKENKGLREKGTYLKQTEDKFLKLGGTKWRKLKFYPVICSLRVSRADVRQQLTNMLAKYGSANNQQRLFVSTDTVVINEQEHILSLNELSN